MLNTTKAARMIIVLLFIVGLTYAGIDEWTSNGPWGGRTGSVCIDPGNPDVLYTTHNGVLKTTNGGQIWEHSSNGIPLDMQCMFVGPSIAENHPNVLYAGG